MARDHIEAVLTPVIETLREHPEVAALLRHELGGDLAIVVGGIETALRPGLARRTRRELLEATRDRALRLLSTLDALLRLHPRAGLEPRAVSIERLLDHPAITVDPRVELVLDGTADSTVLVDVDLLRRLLANLVGNALKHTDGAVLVVASPDPGGVRVEVADHGDGLPDDPAVLFQPFVRGSTGTDGFGLGLALVLRIATRIGIELDVDTGRDGTTFAVVLPTT